MDFPTTFWTALREDPAGALALVGARYWQPLYDYFRLQKLAHEDAEDLTQIVLMHVCREEFLGRADAAKGPFRALLLSVARHVLQTDWRKKYAAKRGGKQPVFSLDPEVLEIPDRRSHTPCEEFDRVWAQNLVRRGMGRLRPEFRDAIQHFYLDQRSYAEVAAALGMSEKDVSNRLSRGKRELARTIQGFVREYCESEEACGEELAYLAHLLGLVPGPGDAPARG